MIRARSVTSQRADSARASALQHLEAEFVSFGSISVIFWPYRAPRPPSNRRPSATHHVDGSLAAVFRRNLVNLRAATRTRRFHVGVSRGRIGGLLVGRDSRRIIIAAVAIVSVRRSPTSIMPVTLVLVSAAEVASTHPAQVASTYPAQVASTHRAAEMTPAHPAAEVAS